MPDNNPPAFYTGMCPVCEQDTTFWYLHSQNKQGINMYYCLGHTGNVREDKILKKIEGLEKNLEMF